MSSAPSFDRLVFFGDSLTDTGGTFELSSQNLVVPIPPENLGYAQRFSNGDVYADIAPRLLGIEAVENFALIGAATLGELPLGTLLALNDLLSLQSPDADLTLLDLDININRTHQTTSQKQILETAIAPAKLPLRELKPVPEPKFQTELAALKQAQFNLDAIVNQINNFDRKFYHKDPWHVQVFESEKVQQLGELKR